MFFLWSWEYFSAVSVKRYSIIDFDFNRLAHIIKFDPIFSWFGDLWNTIFLGIYFFPNRFLGVRINNISKLDSLKLRSNPDSLFGHIFLDFNVRHFYITNFYWSLLFWFLFFTFLFIFRCFLSFLCLLFQSGLHLLLSFISFICLNDKRIFFWLLFCIISLDFLNTMRLVFVDWFHWLSILVGQVLRFDYFNLMNGFPS